MPPEWMRPTGKVGQHISCQRIHRTKAINELPADWIEDIEQPVLHGPVHQQDVVEPEWHQVARGEQRRDGHSRKEESKVEGLLH